MNVTINETDKLEGVLDQKSLVINPAIIESVRHNLRFAKNAFETDHASRNSYSKALNILIAAMNSGELPNRLNYKLLNEAAIILLCHCWDEHLTGEFIDDLFIDAIKAVGYGFQCSSEAIERVQKNIYSLLQ